MALKVDYMVRETGISLVRNLSLTIASILTVAVSLSLVGSAILVRGAVDNATERWQEGVEFIIFLQPEVSDSQRDAIERSLEESAQVQEFTYLDTEAAFEEFTQIFAESPEIVDNVEPSAVPT